MTIATLDRSVVELGEAAGIGPATLAEALERLGGPGYERWSEQVARCGGCSRPIRLVGTVERDGVTTFDTATEPDGVLLKACGNRRVVVCPSCAYVYAGDMWQLLYAGVVGGRKGVPEGVGSHPMVFATLTAPSFGAVHSAHDGKRCRPRREGKLCRHGRPTWCMKAHDDRDPIVGSPLCPECYLYDEAVLFNWWAPELWRLFTIALRRVLASSVGMTEQQLRDVVRVSFAKVAEFQRRGVVHFHAIVRLDGPATDDEQFPTPKLAIPVEVLSDSIRAAAARVRKVVDARAGELLAMRFGTQVDVQAIHDPLGEVAVTPEMVAAYLAKYATKAAEDFGISPRPITGAGARYLGASSHVVRLVDTAMELSVEVPGLERLARWTHMLGFRGHFASKSRRFSTTLGRLRQARADFQRAAEREARGLPPDELDDEDETTLVVASWRFAGTGYTTTGDAVLAASAAARARERRAAAHAFRRDGW